MVGARRADGGDGLRPLFEHTHDAGTTAIVVGFAAVVGLLAGWVTADFGVRAAAFVVGAVGTGYWCYRQPTRRAVLAAGCYSVAGLLAVAPVLYQLTVLTAVADPLRHLLSIADLLVFALFWVVAAVPAAAGYRIQAGPILGRRRS